MKLIVIVAILAVLGVGTADSTVTNASQRVGQYNVSFSIPGERNFIYEITEPKSFAGSGQFAGMTGTSCGLKATDRNTEEYLLVIIAKYDDPIAQAAYEIFTDSKTPDWIATNPNYGRVRIYYNIISQYSAYVVIDKYTMASLRSDMSRPAFQKIAESLHID